MSDTDLPSIAKQLKALDLKEIRNWLKRGELLTQAQELCSPNGSFQSFLNSNKIPKRTAYKAIAAWRDFGGVPTSARFTKEAMDVLSGHEGPIAAAIELSQRQRISGKVARQLLVKHMPTGFFGEKLPKKLAAEGRRKIKGDGFSVIVEFPGPTSLADMIGALTHATAKLREELKLSSQLSDEYTPPPVSPLDRLRTRLAG